MSLAKEAPASVFLQGIRIVFIPQALEGWVGKGRICLGDSAG